MFGLKGYMKVLDASRPWLVYWMLHSLSLLNGLHTKDSTSDNELFHRVVSTLSRMARKETNVGGYGGGPQQLPHCAPTYAAVLALLTVGTEEAYESIDRGRVYRFFMSMKEKNGVFFFFLFFFFSFSLSLSLVSLCLSMSLSVSLISSSLSLSLSSLLSSPLLQDLSPCMRMVKWTHVLHTQYYVLRHF
jgi:prenyltransferase beta subunit